jgi:dienelactone hydrolase
MVDKLASNLQGDSVTELPIEIVAGNSKFVELDTLNSRIFWSQLIPGEKGRTAIYTKNPNGTIDELTSKNHNVRSKVHEYGGKCWAVSQNYLIYWEANSKALWKVNLNDKSIIRITSAFENELYSELYLADLIIDPSENWVLAVAETHIGNRVQNEILAININCEKLITLASGQDFYMDLALNHDASELSFVSWNHPFMSWQKSSLFKGNLEVKIDSIKLLNLKEVSLSNSTYSVEQPKYNKDGELFAISDLSGYYNVYKILPDGCENIFDVKFDCAYPAWVFGQSTYCIYNSSIILNFKDTSSDPFCSRLAILTDKNLKLLDDKFAHIFHLKPTTNGAAFIASYFEKPQEILSITLSDKAVLKRENSIKTLNALPANITTPKSFAIQASDGSNIFAHYWGPDQLRYRKVSPLLVFCHGGPTSSVDLGLDLTIQFFTSRGYCVLAPDYRGSSGYGRFYRESLDGNWGILDVNDVIDCTKYVSDNSLCDPSAVFIRGGSSGGLTLLNAISATTIFKGAVCYYGVTDLVGLQNTTHKFESHYLESLIGKYPQEIDKYLSRSPINNIDKINTPILIFQGLLDKVVPPEQSKSIIASLNNKGIPCKYVEFKEEAHGFRQKETILACLEEELNFYENLI